MHMESFRNIDLYHQGIYYLRNCLYYQKGDKLYYAQPFSIFNSKMPSGPGQSAVADAAKASKRKNLDHHNILPPTIDKENMKFNTRAFMIRYCEEEVELNDICHFRVEIDTDQGDDAQGESHNFSHTEMIFEIELMFSDLLNHGGPEKFSLQTAVEEKVEFKSVAFQKFMLRNICDGIYEYIPVTFDESHFCVSMCTVHSVLMDFRFRSTKLQAQFTSKDNVKKKIEQKKEKKEKKDTAEYCGPTNLTEYLFADKYGDISENINAQEIN